MRPMRTLTHSRTSWPTSPGQTVDFSKNDRAMLVDREFRGAGPDAQHTQPHDVAGERTNGLRGRRFQSGWIHCGNERLAQFDSRITCHRDLIRLRTAHNGHDGFERSVANQFLDQRIAHRSRSTENHGRLRARHEVPFVADQTRLISRQKRGGSCRPHGGEHYPFPSLISSAEVGLLLEVQANG